MTDSANSDDSAVPEFVKTEDPNVDHDVVDISTDVVEPSDVSEVQMIDLNEIDNLWGCYFRYDSAYSDQQAAINSILAVLSNRGYYVFEGACGTGKTLAAVTAGIHAIRDPDVVADAFCKEDEHFPNYQRQLVVTPLNQQLIQFVDEMRGINRSLPAQQDPIPTVVLRSRQDMMVYPQADVELPEDKSFHDTVDDLRQMTREVIKFESDVPLDWPEEMSPSPWSEVTYDWDDASEEAIQHREMYRYNPERAEAVVRIASNTDEIGGRDVDKLTVDGVTSPYPDQIPRTTLLTDYSRPGVEGLQLPEELQGDFDPFYAGAFAGYGGLPFSFSTVKDAVFDRDELFRIAVENGVCPHEAMTMLASDAEVVLGNYYHIFDPQTRLLTDDKIGLLDHETIVTVDEAHQIESRVRDILSESVSIYTLTRAANDIEIAMNYLRGDFNKTPTSESSLPENRQAQNIIRSEVDRYGGMDVGPSDLSDLISLMTQVRRFLLRSGGDAVQNRFDDVGWETAQRHYDWGVKEIEKPLSDPENPTEDDDFTEFLKDHPDLTLDILEDGYSLLYGLSEAYDELKSNDILDREYVIDGVGEFFKRWHTEDSVEYHREIVLDQSRKEEIKSEYPEWIKEFTPELRLFNCIPRNELQSAFGELGGGVLMSATLQPEDVFAEAVGVNDIPHPEIDESESKGDSDDVDSSAEGVSESRGDSKDGSVSSVPTLPSVDRSVDESTTRPYRFDTYPIRFPQKNRLSLIADLPKYTSNNRGSATQEYDEMTSVRQKYADLVADIVSTRGNIMVVMPSYREAEWIHDYVKSEAPEEKRYHLDESSSAIETRNSLEEFFADGEAVMFTSNRGTIVEGVDYDGDKLHSCVVVGIPYEYMSTRTEAVIEAYDSRISSGSGFETAMKIPSIRKVRQAIGRVIRSTEDKGVRVLADERYASSGFSGANQYLSERQQSEFNVSQHPVKDIRRFWDSN